MEVFIDQSRLLTIIDVARLLNVSIKTIRRLLIKGLLEKIVVNNRCVRITQKSVEDYQALIKLQSRVDFKKYLTINSKNNNIFTSSNSQGENMKKHIITSWGDRNGYIVVRKQFKGKRVIVYSGRDQLEAEKALAEFELKTLTSPDILTRKKLFENQNNISFKEYARKYIEEISKPTHRTWEDDRVRFKAVIEFIGSTPLKDIDYSLIKEYRLYRKKQISATRKNKDGSSKNISNGTINREVSFISAVLREACKDEIMDNHPLRGKNLKLEEEQKEIHPITDYDKINQLINNFPKSLRPVIKFAFCTGFRLNTVLNLKKGDFKPHSNEIIILKQNAKNKKEQHFPLSDEVLNILKSIDNDTEYFFPNMRTGKPYTNIRCSFKTAVKRTGLDPDTTFHDLRRSFGTNLMREGYPLKTISKAMGHSSVVMTEKYLRVDEDKDIRPMLNSLGNMISSQKNGNKSGNKEEKVIYLKKKII